jgi:hypothetical protein
LFLLAAIKVLKTEMALVIASANTASVLAVKHSSAFLVKILDDWSSPVGRISIFFVWI